MYRYEETGSKCMYVCVREKSWCGDDGKPARRVKGLDIRTHALVREFSSEGLCV